MIVCVCPGTGTRRVVVGPGMGDMMIVVDAGPGTFTTFGSRVAITANPADRAATMRPSTISAALGSHAGG